MRAIIATDFDGYLRKLIWLTENQTGVSTGICERTPNPTPPITPMEDFIARSKAKAEC
jgi:hypothetical protein